MIVEKQQKQQQHSKRRCCLGGNSKSISVTKTHKAFTHRAHYAAVFASLFLTLQQTIIPASSKLRLIINYCGKRRKKRGILETGDQT